mmetsp:Transcript_6171/g.23309  ORF Transcript_6171/g.23309 Transcript_6171/m.23309 type:complete len:233 (-) Transcript_6171:9209-9907(-)
MRPLLEPTPLPERQHQSHVLKEAIIPSPRNRIALFVMKDSTVHRWDLLPKRLALLVRTAQEALSFQLHAQLEPSLNRRTSNRQMNVFHVLLVNTVTDPDSLHHLVIVPKVTTVWVELFVRTQLHQQVTINWETCAQQGASVQTEQLMLTPSSAHQEPTPQAQGTSTSHSVCLAPVVCTAQRPVLSPQLSNVIQDTTALLEPPLRLPWMEKRETFVQMAHTVQLKVHNHVCAQ